MSSFFAFQVRSIRTPRSTRSAAIKDLRQKHVKRIWLKAQSEVPLAKVITLRAYRQALVDQKTRWDREPPVAMRFPIIYTLSLDLFPSNKKAQRQHELVYSQPTGSHSSFNFFLLDVNVMWPGLEPLLTRPSVQSTLPISKQWKDNFRS